jgi:hypothetical protein
MRTRLRAPIVATVSVLGMNGAACESYRTQNPPRPEPVQNPPPDAATTSTAIPSAASAEVATDPPATATSSSSAKPPRKTYSRQLNERDPKRGQIFSSESGCFVYGDWPDGKPRAPGMMPARISLPCPPSMKDPAWAACAGGTLSANELGSECECFVGGNPPPPPRLVDCPASAKE